MWLVWVGEVARIGLVLLYIAFVGWLVAIRFYYGWGSPTSWGYCLLPLLVIGVKVGEVVGLGILSLSLLVFSFFLGISGGKCKINLVYMRQPTTFAL